MVLIVKSMVSVVLGMTVLSQLCFSIAETQSDSISDSSVEPNLLTTEITIETQTTEETDISTGWQNTTTMQPRKPKTEETPSPAGRGCLKMTYNSTKQIYEFPKDHYHIWFKSLKEKSTISLVFDFSKYSETKTTDIAGRTYQYPVDPWKWHRLELIVGRFSNTNCSRWALLKISTLDVNECLPHHTISRLQASSEKNLVIWSICPPQAAGEWLDEITTGCNSEELRKEHSPTTTIILMVCLATTIVVVVLVGSYAWHLRTEVHKFRAHKLESEYATWDEISPKGPMKMVPITITPPSSPSMDSDNCTFTSALS